VARGPVARESSAPAWTVLADVLLRRAALVVRVAFDHRPDPLAGLKIDDEDLEKLLTELPGLAVADRSVIGALEREARPAVEQARAELRRLIEQTSPDQISGNDTFSRIVRFARLSDLETEVLALSCAVELDPRRQRVVGYLNDDVSQRRLSLFTLQLLFPEQPDVGLAISPGGGLRRAALLAPAEPGVLGSVALAPSPTVFWWLAGDRARDPDLPAGTEHIAPAAGHSRSGPPKPGPPKPGSAKPGPARDETATELPGNDCLDFDRLVLVPGGDKLRRRQAAIASLGPLLASPLPASPPAWDALVRQATLEQGGVLIELDGPLPAEARQRIEQADHLSWALASLDELPLDCLPAVPWRELAVAPAPANDSEWAEAVASLGPLGTLSEDVAPNTADGGPSADGPSSGHPVLGNYGLSAEQLELVRLAAPGVGGISAAVRRLAAGHISTLAPRTRPSRNWDDLVLDRDRTERLREVVARCRHKKKVYGTWGFSALPSSGVVGLFSGPSGTGKTLAAEIISGELGLDLYKVDLAALVSKWVGETEKNLSQVFAAAEASNVALFFDEADAIFGRRSEVSDSHDRYANIEVAYLLQRLERYEGLVLMATNLATNIDPAFLRRIHVHVDFPMPEEPERRRIWERSLPPGAPQDNLDLDVLAKLFKLSGGSIRNATLTAGFLAADAGTAIDMVAIVEAVQREMRKLGRLLTPADFGPYANLLNAGGAEVPARTGAAGK
jgi:ATPase family associated with various cellular activities (AAA)